jgi:hypothetical protein
MSEVGVAAIFVRLLNGITSYKDREGFQYQNVYAKHRENRSIKDVRRDIIEGQTDLVPPEPR